MCVRGLRKGTEEALKPQGPVQRGEGLTLRTSETLVSKLSPCGRFARRATVDSSH